MSERVFDESVFGRISSHCLLNEKMVYGIKYICLLLSHLLELKEHLVQISVCISASLAKMKRILTKGPLGLRLPFCTEDIALLFNQTTK